MEVPEFTIRRLDGEADARLYREIRLESLRRSPEAYGSDFDSENARPLEFFAGRLADSYVLGGFRGETLAGVAGFAIGNGVKVAHKGFIWGVYVRPQARTLGIARSLIEALLAHAVGKVELVHLTVERGNIHARRLYAGLGFAEYGLEQNARKVDGRYLDDVLMAKALV